MTTATRELSEFDKKAFDWSIQAWQASDTFFTGSVQPQMDDDLRRFYGIHPRGSKYESPEFAARSKLFRPKTRSAIRSQEATAAEALFSNRDVISVLPDDEDNLQQKAASEIWQNILQARLTKPGPVGMPWFLTAIGAYQDAMTTGVCVSYNHWQYDEKKKINRPMVLLRPPENIRFDPGAAWFDPVNTSPYWIDMIPMYVKDIRAAAGKQRENGEPYWLPVTDSELLMARQNFTNSTRYVREHKRQDSTDSGQTLTAFTIVWVHRNFIEINGQDYVFFTLSDKAMLTKPMPLEQRYWHGMRPYTMGFCVVETHKTNPSGLSRLGKDQQAEINEVANSRMDNVKLAMMKRWLAKRNRNVDIASLRRAVPNSVTLVNDMDDVKELEFNDVTASAYQEQERLNLDMDDLMGNFSGGTVQSNRSVGETVGGMQLYSANMNKVSGYQLRVFIETWVEPTLAQVVELEKKYEDDQGLFMQAAKASPTLKQLGDEALTDEMLDQPLAVNVDVGLNATDPLRKVERLMLAIAKLREALADDVLVRHGANVQEIIKEIFASLGYKAGKRFFTTDQDPRIAQLEAQVQDLVRQLEAKHPPQLLDAQVRKLNAEADSIANQAQQGALDSGAEQEIAALQEQIKTLTAEYEETIQALEQDAEEQLKNAASDQDLRRYEIDTRAKTEERKAQLKADTDREIAKIRETIRGKAAQSIKKEKPRATDKG